MATQPAPEGIWASSFDVRTAVAICERLAAGESLRAICRADPAMPTEKTVWNWAQRHRGFAEMKAWAMGQARRKALEAQAERDRARHAGRRRAVDGYSEALGDAICHALIEGASLAQVCARDGMPSAGTVYNWLRRYPEFVEGYRLARAMQAEQLLDLGAERAMACRTLRAARAAMRAADRQAGRLYPTRYAPGEPAGEMEVQAPLPDGWTDVWRLKA